MIFYYCNLSIRKEEVAVVVAAVVVEQAIIVAWAVVLRLYLDQC
jgi:hypothetical protein